MMSAEEGEDQEVEKHKQEAECGSVFCLPLHGGWLCSIFCLLLTDWSCAVSGLWRTFSRIPSSRTGCLLEAPALPGLFSFYLLSQQFIPSFHQGVKRPNKTIKEHDIKLKILRLLGCLHMGEGLLMSDGLITVLSSCY